MRLTLVNKEILDGHQVAQLTMIMMVAKTLMRMVMMIMTVKLMLKMIVTQIQLDLLLVI